MERKHTLFARGLIAVCLLATLTLAAPASAAAQWTCARDGDTLSVNLLKVASVTLSRAESSTAITVNGEPCDGASVDNVDTLQIGQGSSDAMVTLDFTNGSFTGKTDENPDADPDLGRSEMEIVVAMGDGYDRLRMAGGALGDDFRFATSTANYNGDSDTDDLTFTGVDRVVLIGGAGNDVLSGGGHGTTPTPLGLPVELFGGSGHDTMTGGASTDIFDGDMGADVMLGGDGKDTITYADRIGRVVVTLDGVANDGMDADGDSIGEESDNVPADIEKVTGGGGDDRLVGSDLDKVVETLDGGGGSDVLSGRGGRDKLVGGIADDILSGGDGDDLLHGNAGTDVLAGGGGPDSLRGGQGNDELRGDGGDDRIFGESADGDDVVSGGEGADEIYASTGADVYGGGSGFDLVWYGSATERPAARVVVSLGGPAGNDGADLDGDGDADEHQTVSDDVESLIGTRFGDILTGSPGADELHGGAGSDRLMGGGGNDRLYGNVIGRDQFADGNDHMDGGPGADTFQGGAGRDTVTYAARASRIVASLDSTTGQETYNDGADTDYDGKADEGDDLTSVENIVGGKSADLLAGSAAANSLFGGPGSDTLNGAGAGDVLRGGGGANVLRGGLGNDLLVGGSANDSLFAGPGHDRLYGGGRHDYLRGDAGDDLLFGGLGSDKLVGGADKDRLTGGAASDVLEGGAGADRFYARDRVRDRLNGGTGTDTVGSRDAIDVVRAVP